jgi:hypothetical protein
LSKAMGWLAALGAVLIVVVIAFAIGGYDGAPSTTASLPTLNIPEALSERGATPQPTEPPSTIAMLALVVVLSVSWVTIHRLLAKEFVLA